MRGLRFDVTKQCEADRHLRPTRDKDVNVDISQLVTQANWKFSADANGQHSWRARGLSEMS